MFKFLNNVNLIIDDQIITNERKLPNEHWIYLDNFETVFKYFQDIGIPKIISFDNDLGQIKEGIDIINQLIEFDLDKCFLNHSFIFNVHSLNTVANNRIFDLLTRYKKEKQYHYIVTKYLYNSIEWKNIICKMC